MIQLSLYIRPKPKGRPRFGRRGHAYTPKETIEFERSIKTALIEHCINAKHAPYSEPCALFLTFVFKAPKKQTALTPKGDLDNLVKSISDAANEVLYTDDTLISALFASKEYGESDRIDLTIARLEEIE